MSALPPKSGHRSRRGECPLCNQQRKSRRNQIRGIDSSAFEFLRCSVAARNEYPITNPPTRFIRIRLNPNAMAASPFAVGGERPVEAASKFVLVAIPVAMMVAVIARIVGIVAMMVAVVAIKIRVFRGWRVSSGGRAILSHGKCSSSQQQGRR